MKVGEKQQIKIARISKIKNTWHVKSALKNCVYALMAFALILPINLLRQVSAISDLTPPTIISGSVPTGATMDTVATTNDGYNESLALMYTSDNLSFACIISFVI